jgi:hypothetical protein
MKKSKHIHCFACDKELKLDHIDKEHSIVECGGIKFRDKSVSYGSRFEYDDISIAICDNCLFEYMWERGIIVKNNFNFGNKNRVSYHNYGKDKYVVVDEKGEYVMSGSNKRTLTEFIEKWNKKSDLGWKIKNIEFTAKNDSHHY